MFFILLKMRLYDDNKHRYLLVMIISAVFLMSLAPRTKSYDMTDAEILLRVKNDRLNGKPDDWLESTHDSPCNWTGISCDRRSNKVLAVDLSSMNISGAFPAEFCLIATLEYLDISNNNLSGSISSDSLSLCSRLSSLNISCNYFVGKLPDFSVPFLNLTILDLSDNNFIGEIPASFANLSRLHFLSLASNLLNGSIPEFLSTLTELTELVLAINPFRPSPLPPSIGRLTKLEILIASLANLAGEIPESVGDLLSIKNFDVSQNNLVGKIPETIGNLVFIKNFDVSHNNLVGKIPEAIGCLKNVEQIELHYNKLSGPLPDTFSELILLRRFDATRNNLTGTIPETLAALPVESLHLSFNFLQGEIPASLALNPALYQLRLFGNNLTGALPESLGMHSQIEEIDVANNNLEGPLPRNLCYRKNLQRLILFGNRFSGQIPNSYAECTSLTYVRVHDNRLFGPVPDGMWGFTGLYHIELTNNSLQGTISTSISNAKGLQQLLISGNNFSGKFPDDICGLPELRRFHSSMNQFSGNLPSCMYKLTKLEELLLQQNMFTGAIPKNVSANWDELTRLDLSGNRFSGNIPTDLGSLPVLTSLNMSNNQLSGEIPTELTKLKLDIFDISYNRLQGKVPLGFNTKYFLPSLIGNPDLCGSTKPLPPCSRYTTKPASHTAKSASHLALVAILPSLAVLVVVLLICLFLTKNKKSDNPETDSNQSWKITPFTKIGFNPEEVLTSLKEENLIGYGGSGRVYRVDLEGGQTVAAKRLWESRGSFGQSEREFNSEVGILGGIRHINVVRLLFSGINEERKVLVYEYMVNGSLGEALHGNREGGLVLDWPKRLDIAIGAAHGLAYLHNDCVPPILHRDFKSSNILLDEDLRPKLADFGLAKALKNEGDQAMSRFIGSYGYISPESAYTTKVTEKSDVYSFGIVLLELITGKKPNDPFFGANRNIVKWVKLIRSSSSPRRGSRDYNEIEEAVCLDQLIDTRMNKETIEYEEVQNVLNVAMLCTADSPSRRPSMTRVLEFLEVS
ncbi:hypothetical protein ABFX02_13G023200 [Erythranthe guttata]